MPDLKRDWTVADRDALPDDRNRYEVIDGELFMTPAPALNHQAAVLALYRILADYVDREKIGYVFASPADVIFSPNRAVQPDVFVAQSRTPARPRSWTDLRHPLLAIEVLSPSTARADRVRKRMLYREEGVNEYWIVDLDARAFERSTPGEPRPEILVDRLEWNPPGANQPLIINIPDFLARVLD